MTRRRRGRSKHNLLHHWHSDIQNGGASPIVEVTKPFALHSCDWRLDDAIRDVRRGCQRRHDKACVDVNASSLNSMHADTLSLRKRTMQRGCEASLVKAGNVFIESKPR